MGKRSRGEAERPDLTPMIDMLCLLLLFFIIASVFKTNERTLTLTLPKNSQGKSSAAGEKKSLTVELNATGLALNGNKYELAGFASAIETIEDLNTPVEMRIDKEVAYRQIIEVFEILKKKGLNNLELVTEE